MNKKLLYCLLALMCVHTRAFATDNNLMQDTFVLDPIVVTGEAGAGGLNRTTAFVVEKSRSNNIADFLVRDPEISFKRKAAIGDSSDIISIRGMESKRIMLNLDGRNISSVGVSGGNYIDFGTIPLDNIERIEVIKGGSSVEYGNSAMGGVINAYTNKPTETPFLSFYGTMGGWDKTDDFHNLRGSYAQKFNSLGISLGISHQKARAFLRNNDYESFHFNPKVHIDMPADGELILGYNFSNTRRGLIRSNRADGNPTSDGDPSLPGFTSPIDSRYPTANGESFAGGSPTPAMSVIGNNAHWRKLRHLMDITYKQQLGDMAFFEVMAFKNHETRHEKNYADNKARVLVGGKGFDPALTRNGSLVLDRKLTVDDSFGFKFKTGLELEKHSFLAGIDFKKMRPGDTSVRYVDKNYNKDKRNQFTGNMESSKAGDPATVIGAFIADKIQLTDDLVLDIGLRADSYKKEDRDAGLYKDTGFSPKAMLTYNLAENHAVSVALYQNYRTPTMPELQWNKEAIATDEASKIPFIAGKKLKPETARAIDLAYRYTIPGKGFIKVSAFYYDIEDYIVQKQVYVDNGRGQARGAYNIDAKIYGATLGASYALLDEVEMRGAVTWQDSKKENDPADPQKVLKRLEYIPEWKVTCGLSWDITQDLNLDANLTYVGPRDHYISTINPRKGKLKDYTSLGASLTYAVDEHLTVEVYTDNMLDKKYEETWGYPAMGFNAGMSLKWKL